MKYVETVLGPVEADRLGPTLMHEHCFVKSPDAYTEIDTDDRELLEFLKAPITPENRGRIFFYMHKHLANVENQDFDLTLKELKYFKEAGGRTIVDVTPPGIGRDPELLAKLSSATGVNIVASTGLYIEPSWPEKFRNMNQQQLREFFVDEIKNGMDGTGIKPGYIGEIGMNDDFTDKEIMCLKAAGEAAMETGLAMTVHQPIFKTFGERIGDILDCIGMDLDKVVLSHCDPTLPNFDYHLSLLQRGLRLQFDEFQMEFPCTYGPYEKRWLPRDIDRIRHIKRLCDAGFEDKITVSYDMGAFKTLYKTYGGGGYGYMFDTLHEYFIYEGVTEEQFNKLLVENPKYLLAR